MKGVIVNSSTEGWAFNLFKNFNKIDLYLFYLLLVKSKKFEIKIKFRCENDFMDETHS